MSIRYALFQGAPLRMACLVRPPKEDCQKRKSYFLFFSLQVYVVLHDMKQVLAAIGPITPAAECIFGYAHPYAVKLRLHLAMRPDT